MALSDDLKKKTRSESFDLSALRMVQVSPCHLSSLKDEFEYLGNSSLGNS